MKAKGYGGFVIIVTIVVTAIIEKKFRIEQENL